MAGILKVDQVQSDSNLSFQVAGANVAYMNSTGLQMTGGQIVAGGNTLLTASGLIYANAGIAFPATQVSSADANTLDDYEEGTWTPTFTFGSSAPSSVTYHTQSGRYTKIGRVVYVECYIRISAYSGGSGNVLVAGFPFTSASSPFAELFIGENAGFTVAGTYYGLSLEVNSGATNAILLKMAPNSASTSVVATEMGSATTVYLIFSGCYTAT